MEPLVVHPEVRAALDAGEPVVAMESAVITHGLPRGPWPRRLDVRWPGWRHEAPISLEAARMMHDLVREAGATPAQVAVLEGELRVGLSEDDLAALAGADDAVKISSSTLGAAIACHAIGGTTVSATLVACTAVSPPIRFFATGGIGGVHRGWQRQPDFSADLSALVRHPVGVVCSGGKSILDLPATLALLEAGGVPVVGYATDILPRFVTASDPALVTSSCVNDAASAAAVCRAHWSLGVRSAVVLTNQVPDSFALDADEMERHTIAAEAAAEDLNVRGSALTPFLLDAIARATDGQAIEANLALLASNARLAAHVAKAFASA